MSRSASHLTVEKGAKNPNAFRFLLQFSKRVFSNPTWNQAGLHDKNFHIPTAIRNPIYQKNPTMKMYHTDTIESLATDRFLEQIGLINLESNAAIEIADANSDSSAAFERAVARLKVEGPLFAANLRERLSRGYRLPPLAIVNALEETEQAERSA